MKLHKNIVIPTHFRSYILLLYCYHLHYVILFKKFEIKKCNIQVHNIYVLYTCVCIIFYEEIGNRTLCTIFRQCKMCIIFEFSSLQNRENRSCPNRVYSDQIKVSETKRNITILNILQQVVFNFHYFLYVRPMAHVAECININ